MIGILERECSKMMFWANKMFSFTPVLLWDTFRLFPFLRHVIQLFYLFFSSMVLCLITVESKTLDTQNKWVIVIFYALERKKPHSVIFFSYITTNYNKMSSQQAGKSGKGQIPLKSVPVILIVQQVHQVN